MVSLELFKNPERRYRVWSAFLSLGIFAALPVPREDFGAVVFYVLVLLWISTALLSYVSFFETSLVAPVWTASFLLSLVLMWKAASASAAILLGLWMGWRSLRNLRLKRAGLILCATISWTSANADVNPRALPDEKLFPTETTFLEPVATPSAIVVPSALTGFKLKELSSCAALEEVPWRFRPDGRKTRMVLRDSFRFQSHTTFHEWQVHQVMDREGLVSYIFRRPVGAGRFEALVVKDATYNKVIENETQTKTIEAHDLRSLINRPALTFYHHSGATISYHPSSVGRSALIVSHALDTGRLIPPLFVRGASCDRPEGEANEDAVIQKAVDAEPKPGASGTTTNK